jgi:hypothetical protein
LLWAVFCFLPACQQRLFIHSAVGWVTGRSRRARLVACPSIWPQLADTGRPEPRYQFIPGVHLLSAHRTKLQLAGATADIPAALARVLASPRSPFSCPRRSLGYRAGGDGNGLSDSAGPGLAASAYELPHLCGTGRPVSFSHRTGPSLPSMRLPRHLALACAVFFGPGSLVQHLWVRLLMVIVELLRSFSCSCRTPFMAGYPEARSPR